MVYELCVNGPHHFYTPAQLVTSLTFQHHVFWAKSRVVPQGVSPSPPPLVLLVFIFLFFARVGHSHFWSLVYARWSSSTANKHALYNTILKKCICTGILRSMRINIYIYDHSFLRGFGQDFFFVSASICDSRNWNSRSYSFVRPPSLGDGSNARRPAVSVPHLDVNADRCRARQARSCKNIACRGDILEIWLYIDVCSAWMIYKIGIISKR